MKTQTSKQAQQAQQADAAVYPLQQFYLSMLCAVINGEKLDVIQQDMPATEPGVQAGRLFMVSTGSSAPQFILSYRFDVDTLTVGVEGRDNRTLNVEKILYAVGLDAYLQRLQRFLRSHLLAAPRAA